MNRDRDILALQAEILPVFFVDPEFETTIHVVSQDPSLASIALLDVSPRNKFFSFYQPFKHVVVWFLMINSVLQF